MASKRRVPKRKAIVSAVLEDNVLLDLVFSEGSGLRLAVWDGENVIYETRWSHGGTTYVPLDLETYQKSQIMHFPERASDALDTIELRDQLASFYQDYLHADESVYQLMADYAMLTWVQERYQAIPYLRFLGAWGTGKTRALDLMHMTSYKSLNMGVGPTVSTVFRNIDRLSPTLIIDEADWSRTSEYDTITKILNAESRRIFQYGEQRRSR